MAHINDFRPGIDRVERDAEGRAWVVDGQGHYAPIEVYGDRVPEGYKALLEAMTAKQRAFLYDVIRLTPYLSEEGKQERLALLRPLLRWSFEIVPLE